MGNKSSYSKYNEDHEPWSLKVLVRIGVLVPGPMNEQKTTMIRVMNNRALREQLPEAILHEYKKQCKLVSALYLIIPNDWKDHTGEFRNYINIVSTKLNINWFYVILVYCESQFDEAKTMIKCRKLRPVLPRCNLAPFDDVPGANPWYFINKHLNEFETILSFADHITSIKAVYIVDSK